MIQLDKRIVKFIENYIWIWSTLINLKDLFFCVFNEKSDLNKNRHNLIKPIKSFFFSFNSNPSESKKTHTEKQNLNY